MTEELDFALLGKELIQPSTGETSDPEKKLKGKVVLLYFGAHWSEACNKFTAKLHMFYQLKQDKEAFEIVYCSMDRSADDYKTYTDQMPWWALPYAISTLPQLATLYHAHGLPYLVVVDTNGKVITKDGAPALQEDPLGKYFPWRPRRIVDILPDLYLDTDGESYLETLELDEKYIMLYFSSLHDEQSQEFTPWLKKAYQILKKQRPDDFEILFVSGDSSQADFEAYFADMPWCALPFEERHVQRHLEKRLDIAQYPVLYMLGPVPADEDDNFGDRALINGNVRAVVENGDYISDFPFYPKPYGDLCITTDDINTHKCLIVFHEFGDPGLQDSIEDAIKQAAADYRGDELVKFYWAYDEEAPICANTRNACNLEPREEPTMVLLDMPGDAGYYVSSETEITPATIKWFLVNKGERQQIGE